MQTLLNRRVFFLSCLMFALVLAATLNLRTSNARPGAVRAELPGSSTKTSSTLAPAKTVFGPRLPTGRVISPFEWRSHNLLSPVGAALFAPSVSAVKSATLAAGGDVNGNGFVNPGDTLAYSVLVSNSGSDAMNVVFTDTLNANLTLVPGSVKASPMGANDSYTSIGNVGINVPAPGLLLNDVSPTANSLAVSAAPSVSAQGGALSVSSNGAFSYNPPVGFTGIDSFSYTVSDGTQTDTGTVTITVSGVIWFVNNTAGACSSNCDGRLSNPFVNISNLNAVNDGGTTHPKDNDNIFVYTGSGNYDGPLTLRNGQRLIGQGATASLATIAGISVPTFSNPLPATGGTRPTSSHTATHVTLNTNNLIRGINLQSTAGTTLSGTSFNNLTVSETAVSTTNTGGACNAAVSLNQSSGTAAINATFSSVAASNCTNGILVRNTTGSFTVQGDGTNNASGGLIQNTSGNGVSLNNVQSISLTSMKIQTTVGSGVKGTLVNGFSFVNGTIDGSNDAVLDGTNSADESNIAFNNITATTEKNVFGTVTITGSTLTNALYHGVDIFNYDGTLSNVTISGNTITSGTTTGAGGTSFGTGIRLVAFGSASTVASVTKATLANNVISNFPGNAGIQAQAGNATVGGATSSFGTPNDATNVIAITGNTIKGFSAANRIGTQAILATVNGKGQGNFNISNNGTVANPVTNFSGTGISLSCFGQSTVTATVNNNVLVANNTVAAAGIGAGTSRTFAATDNPNLTLTISNNNISQTDGNGILVTARDATGSLSLAVKNNTVAAPLSGVRQGIRVDAGNTSSVSDAVCLNISGNTSAGSGGATGIGVRKQGTVATTNPFGLQGIPQSTPTNTDVVNYVNAQNPAGGGTTIISGSNYSQCSTAPPVAQPVDTDGGSSQSSLNTAQPGSGESSRPALATRLQQALHPVFSAFHDALSYVSFDRAFDKAASALAPTVAAAEFITAQQNAATNVPAKTLLINSKGEYRVVPTAAIPATFAGETITINGSGSGFTIPAGESTTIMFSATIASGFTGTSISNSASISVQSFATVTPSVTTTVYQAPSISKGFAPTSVPVNSPTTLTLTISNPNIATITGVAVTDSFPAGLEVDGTPAATNTCGGTFAPAPGATSISLSGGMIGAGSSCAVSVKVKPTTSGAKTNTTGNVTSTEGGTGNTATATLQVNNPPTITAIPQSVAAGSSAATFNIATVNDAEDGPTGVTFSISSDGVNFSNTATLNGVTVTYVANTAGTISATIATTCAATTANFTIKATDTASQSTTTTLTITVTANPGPTLSYSSPQTLTAGTSSSVNPATGPSDNGSVATIVVDSVSPPTGLSASVNNSTGVVMLNATVAGTYTVSIKATDNCGVMTIASFTVNVTCPTITVNPATLPNGSAGNSYTQSITASPAGGGYTFAVTSGTLPPGLTLAADGTLSGTPTTVGSSTFTVTATGFGSCTGSRSYTLTIDCPTITVNPATLPNGTAGSSYTQTLTASPSGGGYTFAVTSGSLPAGLTLAADGTLSGTPTTAGSSTFTVTATGFGSCTGSRSYTLTIDCPTITVNPATLPNATAGSSYSQTITASPSGGSYTFAVTSGSLPPGLSLSSGGALTGTPTTAGSFTFTVTATGFGTCTGSRSYTLTVDCPTITVNPATLPNGTAGSSYTQSITASPAGGSYTFAVTSGSLPAGLTLAADGTLSGTPTTAGSSTFTVTATGFGSCTGSRSYTLTIDCPTITVNPATLPDGTAGTSYSQNITASPAGGNYTFAVTSGSLPPGLTLATNGTLSGTPTTNGTYNFTVTATGFGSCTGSRAYTVTINCPTITLSPSTLPNGVPGQSYNQTITASPSGGSYTFAVTSGSLPPGLTLSSGGTISGTPTTPGTYNFTVTATGFGTCTGSRSYSITIACPTVTITTTSLPDTSRNALYNQTIHVSPSGTYSFAVTSGALPPGLTLNSSTGVVSGTPTTNGTYTFTVTVTGPGSCTTSRTYTISVNGVCGNVSQHDTLPNGTVGASYSGDLSHITPTNDYIITLQSGTLPPGLTIDNVNLALVGTPTTAGSYTFTLRATAPSGCYDDRIFTVVISSTLAVPGDFDGDRVADPAVFRDTQAGWLINLSGSHQLETPSWGAPGDLIASGDYDGDGKVDLAVFSPADGHWRIKRSSDGVTIDRAWGAATDTPVPGDYDGDGKTDIAVYRGAEGNWRIINSSNGAEQVVPWGLDEAGPDDVVPVPSDYDGDGKTDLAVFHKQSGTWSIRRSSDGTTVNVQWGVSTDTPVPGDYDGDGKTDIAVYRGEQGTWYVLRSSDKQQEVTVFGATFASIKDVPVPGDYDGDGKTDFAIWRPALGTWYCRNSSDGTTHTLRLGENGDIPVMAARSR